MNPEVPHLMLESRGNARFDLQNPTTFGRLAENLLRLDDPGCSGRHAVIRLQAGYWILEDLGSTNGTWVNDQQIQKPQALKEGDRIQAGGQVLRVSGFAGHCRACGLELPRGAAFCPGCGQSLAPAVPARTVAMPPSSAAQAAPTPSTIPAPPPPIAAPVPLPLPQSDRQSILDSIAAKLAVMGLQLGTAPDADAVIQAEFVDASWETGTKRIQYQASAFLDEGARTLYFWELTKETSSGVSFNAGGEASFQSGKTLFRKVKCVGFGPDGKTYEFTFDLGAIVKAFKESAATFGWKFKTVLRRGKATYAAAKAGSGPAAEPGAKAKGQSTLLYWILFALLLVSDALLMIVGRGAVFYAITIGLLVLALVLKAFISKGILKPLLFFGVAWIITLIGFATGGMGSKGKEATPISSGTTTLQSSGVSVALPAWSLPEGSQLQVKPDANPPDVPKDSGIVFQSYEIQLPANANLGGVAEIQLPFDKGLLSPGVLPEDGVGAAYYDPRGHSWQPVPCTVDGEKGFVTIYTDHFSKYAAVILKDGRKKLSDTLPRFDSAPMALYSESELAQIVNEGASGAVESPTALEKGWAQFNKAYGLTGAGSTVLEAGVGTETLKNVNKLMNEAGLGFALAQLVLDISNGDKNAAVVNFTKSGAFYSVSKWGGDALGLASAGVTFMDLALTEFGEAALDKNLQKWDGAYRHYYATEPKVMRTAADWFKIVAALHKQSSSAADFKGRLDAEVDTYCDAFWKDAEAYAQVAESTPGIAGFDAGGEAAAGPRKISGNFKAYLYQNTLKTVLNHYMRKLWFLQLRKAEADYEKLKEEMNKVYNVTVRLQNAGSVRNLQACTVRFINQQGQVVHGQSFDGSGQAGVRMSLLGFLRAGGPTTIEVSVPAQDSTPPLNTRLNYQLTRTDTVLVVPYAPVPEARRPEAPKPAPRLPEPPKSNPVQQVPVPQKPPAPPPAPEKKYDYQAALAKWTADYKALASSKNHRDEYWGQDHVYTLEFTVAPHLVMDGPSPGVYGAHQIWDAWTFYTGDNKGKSGRSTVNSFAEGVPGGGLYLSLGELRAKYPQFGR